MLKNWQTLSIGGVVLRVEKPTIVTSLFSGGSGTFIKFLESNPELKKNLLEIRYDLFSGKSARDLRRILGYLEEVGYSYIFTFRSDDRAETELYYGIAAEESAPAVDVDISQIEWVEKHPVTMVSYHGVEGDVTPALLKQLNDQNAELLKLAVAYSSKETFLSDLGTVSRFFNGTTRPICFSPINESSFPRLVASYFVSDIIYASHGASTGKGQMPAEKTASFLDIF